MAFNFSARSVRAAFAERGINVESHKPLQALQQAVDRLTHRSNRGNGVSSRRKSDLPFPATGDVVITSFNAAQEYRENAITAAFDVARRSGESTEAIDTMLRPFELAQDELSLIGGNSSARVTGSDIAWVLHTYMKTSPELAAWPDLFRVLREDLGLTRSEVGERMSMHEASVQSFEERSLSLSNIGMDTIGNYVETGLGVSLRSPHGAAVVLKVALDEYKKSHNGQEWKGEVASFEQVSQELERVRSKGITTYAEYIRDEILPQKQRPPLPNRRSTSWTYNDIAARCNLKYHGIRRVMVENAPTTVSFSEIATGLELAPGSVETIVSGILAMEKFVRRT